jgi:hypothetical protein
VPEAIAALDNIFGGVVLIGVDQDKQALSGSSASTPPRATG